MKRTISEKEYCHDRLGENFKEVLSDYDTERRVMTLIDELIPAAAVDGKKALDVGCGLGFFSERLVQRGARVVACDLGENMVAQTAKRAGCEAVVADALALLEMFGPAQFDLVVSSECIEHTPSPHAALQQMANVLKPGGYLAVSTPNKLWWPVVKAATILKARPFDGLENFSTFRGIQSVLEDSGVDVIAKRGLHLYPFQLGFHGMSTWIDYNLQGLQSLMINLCVLGVKRH
jgi:2-polyprenyl-6-hydroxyphenyl methylase/3-demethylubiquinone-9 3-methyltransferase